MTQARGVYQVLEHEERVVAVTIQDGRSSSAASEIHERTPQPMSPSNDDDDQLPLYTDLASWFHLLTAPEERIVTELGYKAATLRLLDEERQTLELKAAYGLNSADLIPGVVAVAKGGIDQAVLGNIPIEISDARRDPDLQCAEVASREGLAGMLAVPLAVRSGACVMQWRQRRLHRSVTEK